jgi:unsaturated rhamnogalacturonyl hydrolase
MYEIYRLTGEEKYSDYIKAWIDSQIDAFGNIPSFNPGRLDDLQAGVLLFPFYERTGDERYKIAMDTVAWYIRNHPRTPEGGFWHMANLRNQMWLDGLYMCGPFAARYAAAFSEPAFFDLDVLQVELMEKHTRDEKTGLWYHAWDYDRRQLWADRLTGCSPEFWGRAIGWVPVALLSELDAFPAGHPGRETLKRITCDILNALLPWQDETNGMWYQIVDKKDMPDNWPETSCTCLFAAALCKAVRTGIMGKSFLEPAQKAILGVFGRLWHNENDLQVTNICEGTWVGDYAFYTARARRVNDLHGMGAFLLMCAEAEHAF